MLQLLCIATINKMNQLYISRLLPLCKCLEAILTPLFFQRHPCQKYFCMISYFIYNLT